MRKLIVSDRAKQDIVEIRTYISEHNLSAAKSLISALNNTLRALCHTPFMGSIRSEFHPQARCLVVGKYSGLHLNCYIVMLLLMYVSIHFASPSLYQSKVRPLYLVFYDVLENIVYILRILHSARDIPQTLLTKQ